MKVNAECLGVITFPKLEPRQKNVAVSFQLHVCQSHSHLVTHLGYLHESVPEAASAPPEAERQLGEAPLQGPVKK